MKVTFMMKMRGLRRERVRPSTDTKTSTRVSCKGVSLASGNFSHDQGVTLCREDADEDEESCVVTFNRDLSSYLRVTDLKMNDNEDATTTTTISCSEHNSNTPSASTTTTVPNFHHASSQPPPGMACVAHERWVALDDGVSTTSSPVAPFAVQALAESALQLSHAPELWVPADGKTSKVLQSHTVWQDVWKQQAAAVDQVLIWSTTCPIVQHYGSDLPAVRAAGRIPCAAADLRDLLMDSTRVHEYNALSLGRQDVLVLQQEDHDGPFGGTTKVVTSQSRFLRKTLEFTSLLHARQLPDDGRFLIVTRAVTTPSTTGSSEILMGVNVIAPLEADSCLLTTVNHIRSPMVPAMIAKRLGLQAAINFVHDMRRCALKQREKQQQPQPQELL